MKINYKNPMAGRKKVRKKHTSAVKDKHNDITISRHFLSRRNPSLPKTSAVHSLYSSSYSKPRISSLPKRPKEGRRRGTSITRKRRIYKSLPNKRRELSDSEINIAKPVIETFLNKIGINTFYTIDVYEYCKADVDGLVSLSDLQSALSCNEVYCSMPFLKLLKSVIFGVGNNTVDNEPLFDCGQLINVVNQLDQMVDEKIVAMQSLEVVNESIESIATNDDVIDDFNCDNFEDMLNKFTEETADQQNNVGNKNQRNANTLLKPKSPIQKSNSARAASPVFKDAISLTAEDSLSLQHVLNKLIVEKQEKEAIVKEQNIQLHILQAAEKERLMLNKKNEQLDDLKKKNEEAFQNLKSVQRNYYIRKHMIKRTFQANIVIEKKIRDIHEVLKHYDNSTIVQQLHKAQQDAFKAKKELSNCQKKLYSIIDSQNDRLKERLEELQDALVIRTMGKINEKRREDIANGVYYNPEKLQAKIDTINVRKARLLLSKKWSYYKGIIEKLFNTTGTFELDTMVAKVLNQSAESDRLKKDVTKLEEKLMKLRKQKTKWKETYDLLRFGTDDEIGQLNMTKMEVKKKKVNDVDEVLPAGMNYDALIEGAMKKIRKQEKRIENFSVRYRKLRQIVAEMTMRVRSMMKVFDVTTKEVDMLLQTIETDSDFSRYGNYLAQELVEGLEKSIFALNKKAENIIMTNASPDELSILMMAEFDDIYNNAENEPSQNNRTRSASINKADILNQVEHLKVNSQNHVEKIINKYDQPLNQENQNTSRDMNKNGISIISVRDLHGSAKLEMNKKSINIIQRQAKKRQNSQNNNKNRSSGKDLSQEGTVGTSVIDYISKLQLRPDLNYNELKAPLGENIRVSAIGVDTLDERKHHSVVFELIRNITGLLKQNKYTALTLFKKIDKDKSGAISKSELWDGLRELGVRWKRIDFDLLYERFDSDGDDCIGADEFLRIIDPEHKDDLIVEKLKIEDVVVIKGMARRKIHERVVDETKKATKTTVSKEEWREEMKDYDIKALRKDIKLKSDKRVKKEMKKKEKMII